MLKSMTAFARIQQNCDAGSLTWEIRSVNHRYLEISMKLPEDFKRLEADIRQCVAKYLHRGKIEIALRYTLDQTDRDKITLNEALVASLGQLEHSVLNIIPEAQKLSVANILAWPGVITEPPKDLSPIMALTLSSVEKALEQLVETRETEGKALREMMTTRCTQISDIVKQLRVHRPAMVLAMHEKWKANLNEKQQQWATLANQSRLEQELAILAQKLDVDEELDRLDTHIVEVNKVLKHKEAVGRRLDFLMQELNREANTLSSKSQDSISTQWSVDLKVLIEQMREQVQNIE